MVGTLHSRTTMKVMAVVGVLFGALALRLAGLADTNVWADEGTSLLVIRATWWDLLARLHLASDHPPLSFLLFKAWSLLFSSEPGMRLLPVLWGVAAVAVLMRTAHLIEPRSALPTGLIAAVSPVPVHYSQELRCYSLLYLLTALAFWSAQRVRLRPARPGRLALLSVVSALAVYTHAVGCFVWPMCAMFLVAVEGRKALRELLRPGGLWLWLIMIAPMLWIYLGLAGDKQDGWWIEQVELRDVRTLLSEYFGLSIVGHWQQSRSPRPVWIAFMLERLLMVLPALLAAAGLMHRPSRRPGAALVVAAGTYLTLIEMFSLMAVPSILVRTLLPAWAPLILLLGLGAAPGMERGRRMLPAGRGIAIGALAGWVGLCGAGWLWYAESGIPRRRPAHAAYQAVRERLGPHDLVIFTSPALEELTAYYLGEVVPPERRLGTHRAQVAGMPPVRIMAPPARDPHWPDRMRAAMARAEAESGGRYSIWCIAFGLIVEPAPSKSFAPAGDEQAHDVEPSTVYDVLAEHHRVVECFGGEDLTAIAVGRYELVPSR